jgi:hypothetical protein
MSRKWNEIPDVEKQEMSHLFDVRLTADLLIDPEEPPQVENRPVRFDEIYEIAIDPKATIDGRISRALETDARLKRDFEALLESTAICWFPVAAAAAGVDGLDEREEDGFGLRIRTSSAGDDQVYVMIRLKEGWDIPPTALVALPLDQAPVRVPLPEEIDGVYQLIEAVDSAIVKAIRDPKSRLALQ